MIDIIFICWMIFLLYWGISALFVKKSVEKRKFGKFWLLRAILILVVLYFIFSNGLASQLNYILIGKLSFLANIGWQIAGNILAVLGLAGALWARITIGRNWSGYVTYKKNHELVTDGPYRYIRHPIYTSVLLMMLGTFLYYGTYFILAMFIMMMITFLLRTKREEKIMIRLFGKKYENYMKKSKSMIPYVW